MSITRVLKIVAWVAFIVWMGMVIIAIAYKDDPIIRASVRSVFVSAASVFTDVRDLKDQIKQDIKKDLRK